MIRVMHILTDSNIGGAGHHLLALLSRENGLDRNIFQVQVVLPENARLIPLLESQGVHCIEVPYLAERSFSAHAIRIFCHIMHDFKPHIVHTHASLSGRIAARIYNKCRIVHTRHSVFEPRPMQTQFPIRQILGALNNHLSDAIIAVSPAAKDNLLALGVNSEKMHVIFNGMPQAKAYTVAERVALREKYNIPQDAFVLAQMARLTEVKGQNDVLTAAHELPAHVMVLIAGDGELRPHLEARIKNENIHNVRLLGFIEAVEEILAIMDVQLSASFGTEATSLALIQGMSVGKPAIVTDYGGNPYVIKDGENGIVVPTRHPSALADAVKRLCSDPDMYLRLAKGSCACYASHFTLEEMVKKTESLYNDMSGE